MAETKTLPKTHWKKLYNPNYFGAWDIPEGEDLTVTILGVGNEMVTGADGKKDECTIVQLKNQKPWILNKTNAKTITQIYKSPYIEDWHEKKVKVYVAQVNAFGGVHDAIRVRPQAVKDVLPILSPDSEKWEGAKEALSKGNTTIESIKKHYQLSDENAKKLQG